jgi:hypothetical protein
MKRLLATTCMMGLALGLAACGDNRSEPKLNGVATSPMGGPAHGAWDDGSRTTRSETTTTTTAPRY